MPRWEGPFTIINRIDPVTYRVEDETRITTVHVQRLKLIKRDRAKLSTKIEEREEKEERERLNKF